MVVIEFAYSVIVHAVAGVLEKLLVPHLIWLACIRPRLCPGSCMRTMQLSPPFIQVCFEGLTDEPSSPKPPNGQTVVRVKYMITWLNMPAGRALSTAVAILEVSGLSQLVVKV